MPASTPGCDPTTTEAADEPWDADEAEPRPPPPKRRPPTGPLRARTRMPIDRETRWPKPHEAVAPRCTMCRNRTKAEPAVAPPERAARDPDAQLPLRAAAPATQPTATKSTTSAVIIEDATAVLAPPEGGSSTCGRCWSEDHRTLGATSPKRGAATAQPTGDDRGEPRTPNRRPAATARDTRR